MTYPEYQRVHMDSWNPVSAAILESCINTTGSVKCKCHPFFTPLRFEFIWIAEDGSIHFRHVSHESRRPSWCSSVSVWTTFSELQSVITYTSILYFFVSYPNPARTCLGLIFILIAYTVTMVLTFYYGSTNIGSAALYVDSTVNY